MTCGELYLHNNDWCFDTGIYVYETTRTYGVQKIYAGDLSQSPFKNKKVEWFTKDSVCITNDFV